MTKEKKEQNNGEVPSFFKKLNPWFKLIAAILTLVILVGGVLWGMTSTFAMKPEIKAVESSIDQKLDLVAQKSVETFNMFQKSFQQDQNRRALKSYTNQIDESRRRERYLREDIQRNPGNQYLKNRLQDELNLQRSLKIRRDQLLSN